jgi:chemotaxis protein methyltransferase CheR
MVSLPGERCGEFLEWALPQLELSPAGFRRVRHQVCRRIAGRLQALQLPHCGAYREYLEAHPAEWATLETFCRIPISRFFRERIVFDRLATDVLPALAAATAPPDAGLVRCWSAGCASGEEPYSLAILWTLGLADRFPGVSLRVVATDIDEHLLQRALTGTYRRSSLREVPEAWLATAFDRTGQLYAVKPAFKHAVEFCLQDLRERLPVGPFDLILCRYLPFTYFDPPLQRRTLERLLTVLRPGGALVIGLKERLPEGARGVEPWAGELRIFRRVTGEEEPWS